jgi:catechol 2,3-dioxygenase-like lactoylglutathione lyase family enzyme
VLIGFDHLVIMVEDLAQASQDYRQLGFEVVDGGRHGSGTHNTLIALEDGSYLELIAFHETNEAHRWWKWKLAGGGLIDFCMQSDDITSDLATFARAGVAYGAPYALSRARPDGYALDWDIAVPEEPRTSGAPFLIRDRTPRVERAPQFGGHANGITRVAQLVYAVADTSQVASWAKTFAGVTVEAVERGDLVAKGWRVRFAAGTAALSTVEYLAPLNAQSPLSDVLAQRGAAPFAIEFAGAGASGPLNGSLSHGARLSVVVG